MTDVDFFVGALNRLKESLGVSKDKQVAEALGMSDKALNARKARHSFPEIELLALSARRPELKLDVAYVLTGERVSDWQRTQLALTAETILEMEPDGDGPLHRSLGKAMKATGKLKTDRQPIFDKLQDALAYNDEKEFKLVMELAFTLTERLRGLRAKQAEATAKKTEKKTA